MGINALAHATLLNYDGAANEFLKWDHASGQVVPGLTRRRSAECCLFLS
ncbi:lysozyme [Salmonella enterica]|uniref:Lysozyme n=1 Tax=Salmonella enterica TaxID=28901 RepID=A0A633PW11_SALER|nr:lysozyme [Salmonella enterica]ECU0366660.1 lysozyme [Salmonella enterica subsp. enterica serovar Newport]EDQ2288749.1 lysozyme [Salmonella enterica subsp. arizonae]EDW1852180.1 lysozyme [Salmonella enterica subsp. diarizonae]EAP9889134.1 lysozyme [Salmonella enterica]